MGVEIVGSEMAKVSVDSVVENGKLNKETDPKESINFGTHAEEPVKIEGSGVSDANFPKNAVDEWPAPKQIHSFYFVRYRPFDDPKIKAKIEYAEKELMKRNQSRFQVTEELKAKRLERAELIGQLKVLNGERKQFTSILDEKKKEIEPLQQALGKLRNNNNAGRGGLCSTEEELNDLINSLQFRIQHEIIPLKEEKEILREIKQLEGTRGKVIANAAMRAKIQDSLGQKDAIQDQVKLIGVDLEGVRKERQAVWAKINQLEEKVKALDNEIKTLQDELTAVTEKREQAYSSIQELRKQRDEGNSPFYQSRAQLNKARELAAVKDVKALEELSFSEVENFMSSWNNGKKFRDDYEKRILPSLDQRQLSRDGRMRNPDEKSLVAVETSAPSVLESLAKASAKRPKEELKPTPQKDTVPSKKSEKEANKTDSKSSKTTKTTPEHVDEIVDKDNLGDKPKKNPPPVEKEIDEAKLKELKREEETAKQKEAMERKKKKAEKAAAKAAIKAQKEAEKKLKEREKKLKKKATGSNPATDPEELTEAVTETAEGEKVEGVAEEEPAPVNVPKNEKAKKETTIRQRTRGKNLVSAQRAISKRKKSMNYWMWAAPAAILLFVLLALVYYHHLL